MRHDRGRGAWMLLLALGVLLAAGCSAPPPCEVDPGQLEQARAEYEAAQTELERAAAEQQEVEGQLSALRAKVVSEQQISELEAQLEELKKGSGR